MNPNPNSMLRWWPALQGLGLPLPRTEIVTLAEPVRSDHLLYACVEHDDPGHGESGDSCTPLLATLVPLVASTCLRLGYPVFLRTDLMSGKHGWLATCHVPDADAVAERMFNLVEDQALHMWMHRDDAVAAFVARELLDAQAPFTAFHGLPIAREFRYFVEDGKVLCHHAYWEDEDNIAGGDPTVEGKPAHQWREALRLQGALEPYEESLLGHYAERASRALGGAWSVDFMWARRPRSGDGPRWWLIDAARAEDSWHPEHANA